MGNPPKDVLYFYCWHKRLEWGNSLISFCIKSCLLLTFCAEVENESIAPSVFNSGKMGRDKHSSKAQKVVQLVLFATER